MPSPYILYAFSGPAWALRARLRFALEAPRPSHAAIAAARIARLGVMAEQSPTWRVQGREIEVARLMRCVAEEVEPC